MLWCCGWKKSQCQNGILFQIFLMSDLGSCLCQRNINPKTVIFLSFSYFTFTFTFYIFLLARLFKICASLSKWGYKICFYVYVEKEKWLWNIFLHSHTRCHCSHRCSPPSSSPHQFFLSIHILCLSVSRVKWQLNAHSNN